MGNVLSLLNDKITIEPVNENPRHRGIRFRDMAIIKILVALVVTIVLVVVFHFFDDFIDRLAVSLFYILTIFNLVKQHIELSTLKRLLESGDIKDPIPTNA